MNVLITVMLGIGGALGVIGVAVMLFTLIEYPPTFSPYKRARARVLADLSGTERYVCRSCEDYHACAVCAKHGKDTHHACNSYEVGRCDWCAQPTHTECMTGYAERQGIWRLQHLICVDCSSAE